MTDPLFFHDDFEGDGAEGEGWQPSGYDPDVEIDPDRFLTISGKTMADGLEVTYEIVGPDGVRRKAVVIPNDPSVN